MRRIPLILLLLLLGLAGCKKREITTVDAGPPEPGPWAFGKALPATAGFSPDVVQALDLAWRAKPAGQPTYTNRLFLEASPYLRQHAHNPVNWYPWSDAAFAEARRTGKPILLSIGYSTCHWCHVMAHESFEDEAMARLINEHYIAIKVDREERPEVDHIYVSAVRALSGSAGWPLTVWLTPDRRPFFGGTYYPRADFEQLLLSLAKKYVEDPAGIATQADTVTHMVENILKASHPGELDAAVYHSAVKYFIDNADRIAGGMRSRQKFPSDLPIRALLRYHRRTGNADALAISVTTLEHMARGALHDHLGGGFHRYTTDAAWRSPHYEKMLYDNALLAVTYAEAYQLTRRPDFATVVTDTLAWADRELSDDNGGFYAALDADSPGPDGKPIEGRYYTWTVDEIKTELAPERALAFSAAYALTPSATPQALAQQGPALPDDAILRGILLAARDKRPRPPRDEKILTGWNALMISALSRAALALDEPEYAARATRAAEYLWTRGRSAEGRVYRVIAGGAARLPGTLEDYAYTIAAFLDLYEASGAQVWLERAIELDRSLEEHFEDREVGGFFRTADDHEALIIRDKPAEDGATPSPTAVHVLSLMRLHELTTRASYQTRADKALRLQVGRLKKEPNAVPELLLAVDFALDLPKEIVIVATGSRVDAAPFILQVGQAFVPNRSLVVTTDAEVQALGKVAPLAADKHSLKGQTTAFVCQQGACQLPTGDPRVFAGQIAEVEPLPTPAGAPAP